MDHPAPSGAGSGALLWRGAEPYRAASPGGGRRSPPLAASPAIAAASPPAVMGDSNNIMVSPQHTSDSDSMGKLAAKRLLSKAALHLGTRRPSMPELFTPPDETMLLPSLHSTTNQMAQDFQAKLTAIARPDSATASSLSSASRSPISLMIRKYPINAVHSLDDQLSDSQRTSSDDERSHIEPVRTADHLSRRFSPSPSSLLSSSEEHPSSLRNQRGHVRKCSMEDPRARHGSVSSQSNDKLTDPMSSPSPIPIARDTNEDPKNGRRRSTSFSATIARAPAFFQWAVGPKQPSGEGLVPSDLKRLDTRSESPTVIKTGESTTPVRRRRNSIVIETTTINHVNRGLQGDEVNNYKIIHELGKGSYGSVYLAVSKDDECKYAIKAISKRRLRRRIRHRRLDENNELQEISREVAILKKISVHPYFVRLAEFLSSEAEDTIFMVFDLCEKGPIMRVQMNERAQPYTEATARRYFRQIVLAIEFLHYQRIIHGDIKPDNILLNAEDDVQFSDFGVSKIFEGDDDWLQSTSGSPAFNAPEICSSATKKFQGKAVDVWAMGVTLYCLVCGRCPYEADNIVALYAKILHNRVEYPDDLSRPLRDLLERMMDKNFEQRITVRTIRNHPWVTCDGQDPLPSEEENCKLIDVTVEEVGAAVKTAVSGGFAKFLREKIFRKVPEHQPSILLRGGRSTVV